MPRGGSRKHPSDCKCGSCPKVGRPKSQQHRPVTQQVAARIKARIKAEELWVFAAQKAYAKAKDTSNTADLVRILEYLDDRDLGRCVDNVNHLHNKPIEHNVSVSLSERFRLALMEGEERVKKLR